MKNNILRKYFLLLLLIPTIIYPKAVMASTRLSSSITTTSSYLNPGASALVDNNASTTFNIGGLPPQWVQLDLNSPYTISKIVLNPDQSPPSGYRTSHTVSFYNNSGSPIFSTTIDKFTSDTVPIQLTLPSPLPNVRYVRVTTNKSNSWVSWRGIDVYTGDQKESSLKYFGYYGLVDVATNNHYFNEISQLNNSNIGILYGYSDPAKLRPALDAFRANKLKAYIMPRDIFFHTLGNPSTGAKAILYSDYSNKWQSFKKIIDEYPDVIHGFYYDEALSSTIIYTADFLAMTGQVAASYPDKSQLLVESVIRLENNSMPADYYQYITDVGFDYYFATWSANNDEGWSRYLSIFSNLTSLVPGKKIWIVTDGIAQSSSDLNRWPDAFEKYLGLALTTPNTVGILNFIWHSLAPAEPYALTLRSTLLPGSAYYNSAFSSRQIKIGRSIIASPTPSPSPIPGDINGDGHVNLHDYNDLVKDFGSKYTLFDYNNLVANYEQ